MTKKEVTEIFSVMMSAWPNAEMFRGGMQKLGTTITLWTRCLEDVECWIAQQAVMDLCRTCKFPPSIAEMRECSLNIKGKYKSQIDAQTSMFRMMSDINGRELAYQELGDGSIVKGAIDRMGGLGNWDYYQYESCCWEILKQIHTTQGQAQPRLTQEGGKQ